MEGVDIRDGSGEVLTVTLQDILAAIAAQIQGWDWNLLHFWGVGELPGERSVVDYEEMARRSPHDGVRISEKELQLLASHTDQIIDAVLVGNAEPRTVKKCASDNDLYRDNDLVIEANDSTYWRVVSHRKEIIESLRKRFTSISTVAELQ